MPIWVPHRYKKGSGPIYREIVQAIADDIASGRLSAGDRLPPHRDLADQLKVARGTIAKAYAEAKKLGLVRGGVGSGTFVLAPDSGLRPYSTLLEPPVVYNDMTTNYPLPGIDPDPAEAFQELAVRPDRMALLRYQSNLGMRRHRLAGVQWARRLGVDADIGEVLLCSGAQHALFVVLAHVTDPGDAILVEEWSYPGLHGIAETLHIRLIAVEMDRWGLNIEGLERVCEQQQVRALYCMPTVHNPMGSVLSATRRKHIARLARRYDFLIIEDEANRLLAAESPPTIRSSAPERTYFVASTSKILCAGLRVAFLVAPEDEVSAVARHIWATQWMVSPLGVEIVTIWLEKGVVDRTIERKRAEASRRQQLARDILADFTIRAHSSSLHLWLQMPPDKQAHDIVLEARRWNVAVTPSSAFWMRKNVPLQGMRIALGGIEDRRTLERGLTTLADILKS